MAVIFIKDHPVNPEHYLVLWSRATLSSPWSHSGGVKLLTDGDCEAVENARVCSCWYEVSGSETFVLALPVLSLKSSQQSGLLVSFVDVEQTFQGSLADELRQKTSLIFLSERKLVSFQGIQWIPSYKSKSTGVIAFIAWGGSDTIIIESDTSSAKPRLETVWVDVSVSLFSSFSRKLLPQNIGRKGPIISFDMSTKTYGDIFSVYLTKFADIRVITPAANNNIRCVDCSIPSGYGGVPLIHSLTMS